MKVMLDTCVWGGALTGLRAAGHDVVWTGEWDKDPGDDEILARAQAEERVLVTLDKDFGEMAVFRGVPHHEFFASLASLRGNRGPCVWMSCRATAMNCWRARLSRRNRDDCAFVLPRRKTVTVIQTTTKTRKRTTDAAAECAKLVGTISETSAEV